MVSIAFIDRRKQRRPMSNFNTPPKSTCVETDAQAKNEQIDADALLEGRLRREIETRAEARELAAILREPWA